MTVKIQKFTRILIPVGDHEAERFKTLCPLHSERTPSFVVYADQSNHFYCFGCQKGGDTITFIRLINNCSFIEAVNFLNR